MTLIVFFYHFMNHILLAKIAILFGNDCDNHSKLLLNEFYNENKMYEKILQLKSENLNDIKMDSNDNDEDIDIEM